MAGKGIRYQRMEKYITYGLIADAVLFILYLIFAGFGIIWMKAICAVAAIVLSAAILGYLYLTRELLRPRSLWMSVAAAAVAVCVLFSLILNFPSPKYQLPEKTDLSVVQE